MWVKLTLPPWRRRRCPLEDAGGYDLQQPRRHGRGEVARVGTSRLAGLHRLDDPVGPPPPQRQQPGLGALPSRPQACRRSAWPGPRRQPGRWHLRLHFASAGAWGSSGGLAHLSVAWRPRPRPGPRRSRTGGRASSLSSWACSRQKESRQAGAHRLRVVQVLAVDLANQAQRWRRTRSFGTQPTSAQHHPLARDPGRVQFATDDSPLSLRHHPAAR